MIAAAEPVANGHAVPVHQNPLMLGKLRLTVECQTSVLLQHCVIEVGNMICQVHGISEKDCVMPPRNEAQEGCHCCADVESKL